MTRRRELGSFHRQPKEQARVRAGRSQHTYTPGASPGGWEVADEAGSGLRVHLRAFPADLAVRTYKAPTCFSASCVIRADTRPRLRLPNPMHPQADEPPRSVAVDGSRSVPGRRRWRYPPGRRARSLSPGRRGASPTYRQHHSRAAELPASSGASG